MNGSEGVGSLDAHRSSLQHGLVPIDTVPPSLLSLLLYSEAGHLQQGLPPLSEKLPHGPYSASSTTSHLTSMGGDKNKKLPAWLLPPPETCEAQAPYWIEKTDTNGIKTYYVAMYGNKNTPVVPFCAYCGQMSSSVNGFASHLYLEGKMCPGLLARKDYEPPANGPKWQPLSFKASLRVIEDATMTAATAPAPTVAAPTTVAVPTVASPTTASVPEAEPIRRRSKRTRR